MGKAPTTPYVDEHACQVYEVAVKDEEDAMAFTVLVAGKSPDDAMATAREEWPHAALWVVGLATDASDEAQVTEPDAAMLEVEKELGWALTQFLPMASPHEGWAIIKEEMDELWELVCLSQKQDVRAEMRAEAKQVAAMGVRFMMDLC